MQFAPLSSHCHDGNESTELWAHFEHLFETLCVNCTSSQISSDVKNLNRFDCYLQ